MVDGSIQSTDRRSLAMSDVYRPNSKNENNASSYNISSIHISDTVKLLYLYSRLIHISGQLMRSGRN